uniref:Uncharacterized protein n=1 Tax=Glossina palpalis gambiensis TaxID=67801 RepID=A0A1B0BGB8_9MUSC
MNRIFKMRQMPVIVFERGPKAIITLVVIVFVLSACLASSNASVLNNINNVLRDVPKKTKPLAIKNASTNLSVSAPDSLGTKTDEQENNTEEYNDSSSAELLRFVDDNESVEDMVNHNSNDDVDNDDNDDENDFNINLSDLDNNDDNDSSLTASSSLKSLSLEDQVRLLSKQLNVLMTRRREDYELLERNLLKSLRITMEKERKQNSIAAKINANVKNSDNNNWDLSKQLEQLSLDLLKGKIEARSNEEEKFYLRQSHDIDSQNAERARGLGRTEDQKTAKGNPWGYCGFSLNLQKALLYPKIFVLFAYYKRNTYVYNSGFPNFHDANVKRQEVQSLQTKHLGGNNERLTIEWLQQSVGELRKQLVELQQIASNAMRDVTTRTQSWEDLATIRSDFQQLKLELATVKERQQQTEVYIQELREETQQQEEDFRRLLQNKHQTQQQQTIKDASAIQDSRSSSSSSSSISISSSNEETMDEIENIQVSFCCWLKAAANFKT